MAEPLLIFHVDCNYLNLRPDYLRAWLQHLADLGYTALLWEVEDKVQWETCPECVWPEAMSKADFREILTFARALGMENIPLLQTIGHAEYVLKHEPYVAWRENAAAHDCYCTSNPEVRRFLKRWIAEYLELFGELRYFHLGGDEAYEFGKCDICRPRRDEIGPNALYAEHILELAEPIREAGVRPGIWCDMILHYPDQVEAIPAEFVIWDWNYWDGMEPTERGRIWGQGLVAAADVTTETRQEVPELLDDEGRFVPFYTSDMLTRLGREVIICSATRSHGDSVFVGDQTVHGANVAGAARKVAREKLLGTCVTSWAIRLHSYETQQLWFALAAAALARPQASLAELERHVAEQLFGRADREIFDILAAIGRPLPFASAKSTGIQFNNLKDPIRPPPDYVANLIAGWDLDAQNEILAERSGQIREGANRLKHWLPGAQRGFTVLEALSQAAEDQLWSARLAQGVLAKAAGKTVDPSLHAAMLARKRAYHARLSHSLTPQSARLIADLVYDAVLAYLRDD